MSLESPKLKFNVVVYFDKTGLELNPPKFIPNCYVTDDGGNGLCACDATEFDQESEDPTKAMMTRIISHAFKYPGIWIEGLNYAGHNSQRIYNHQRWLLTNMSKEELEQTKFYL
jgi:hypothetical protein